MKRAALLLLLVLLGALTPAHAQDDLRGWLFVPDINLSAGVGTVPIVAGEYDMDAVGLGVGWLEGTAWVTDDWARIVLGAHRHGAFARLDDLVIGSWIYLIDWPHSAAAEGYRVVLITVTTPADYGWLLATESETLTLITCAGARDELRLIVHAERAW